MFCSVTSIINRAIIDIRRRAENVDPATLAATFVDTGPVFSLLQSKDHQILYGRRGTGKTHALKYLTDSESARGSLPVFIDLRTIGSTGGLYADSNLPIAERGTRLLLDVLEAIQNQLMDHALALSYESDETFLLESLDNLAAQVATSVRVVGMTEQEGVVSSTSERHNSTNAEVNLSTRPGVSLGTTNDRDESNASSTRVRVTGIAQHRVHFGAVAKFLRQVTESIAPNYVWILLDEWSSIPSDLQPILADLIKRAILPTPGFVVKIAAIEQRSRFRVVDGGESLGFEIGSDIVADLDLDDILVFKNDADQAVEFFKELIFRHVIPYYDAQDSDAAPKNSADFVRLAFTQEKAFEELVRAAEGVPRDAINIGSMSALSAGDAKIGIGHVRKAARDFYQRDKESAVASNVEAEHLLNWIIQSVIGSRQARGFLLRQGDETRYPLIGELYDARVIHVIKKGVASKDESGVRYNVYSIDYGAYVELIATAKEPTGLFDADTDDGAEWVQVPQDDYRSIRRAILDMASYEAQQARSEEALGS